MIAKTLYKSDFLRILEERGFIYQCSAPSELDERLCAGEVSAYNGFDLTADSLHVGHLVPIMMLRWLQKTGHKPIVLMGGGTTRVGDPSFRDSSRPLLSDEQIETNLRGIRRTFEKYLAFDGTTNAALMVNNADWLDQLGYIAFLRDFGQHFTINRMLTFDSVRMRLEREQSLSLLEFNYMVLQAFDFVQLARMHGCTLQMGASDQWGNIINGVELGRRADGRELFALTAPLLTTSSGVKMGKSAAGAVWLNEDRLSTFDFWQYWRNVEDADVGRFLRLFTELPLEEVGRLDMLGGSEINDAKKILADEVTTLCRGQTAAAQARSTAEKTFETRTSAQGLPTVFVPAHELAVGLPVADLLVTAGLVKSKGEGRRLIKDGGARLNDQTVSDETRRAYLDDFQDDILKLSAGKKRHVLVRIK